MTHPSFFQQSKLPKGSCLHSMLDRAGHEFCRAAQVKPRSVSLQADPALLSTFVSQLLSTLPLLGRNRCSFFLSCAEFADVLDSGILHFFPLACASALLSSACGQSWVLLLSNLVGLPVAARMALPPSHPGGTQVSVPPWAWLCLGAMCHGQAQAGYSPNGAFSASPLTTQGDSERGKSP